MTSMPIRYTLPASLEASENSQSTASIDATSPKPPIAPRGRSERGSLMGLSFESDSPQGSARHSYALPAVVTSAVDRINSTTPLINFAFPHPPFTRDGEGRSISTHRSSQSSCAPGNIDVVTGPPPQRATAHSSRLTGNAKVEAWLRRNGVALTPLEPTPHRRSQPTPSATAMNGSGMTIVVHPPPPSKAPRGRRVTI